MYGLSAQTGENEEMAGRQETESEVPIEIAILAEVVDNIAGGLYAIAEAINRLADATAGEEMDNPAEDEVYLDGTRKKQQTALG